MMTLFRTWYALAILSCAACVASNHAGGADVAVRPVLSELDELRSATKVRVLLVPQHSIYFVPVRESNLESFACTYESDAPMAIASLLDLVSKSVSETAADSSRGDFAPRTGILFHKNDGVVKRLYFEITPLPGLTKVRGEMDGRQIRFDPAIRTNLEAWARRSDVMKTGTGLTGQEPNC